MSARLILEVDESTSADFAKLDEIYSNSILEFSYLDYINQTIPLQNYSASNVYTIQLNSVANVNLPYLLATFRASVTATGRYAITSPSATSLVSIQDQNNKDLLDQSPLKFNYYRYIECAKHTPGLLFNALPILALFIGYSCLCFLTFLRDPKQAILYGEQGKQLSLFS